MSIGLLSYFHFYHNCVITLILWRNESNQVMTLVTWVVMLPCNVINYLPYIIVMIELRSGNDEPHSIRSPSSSTIPLQLTIDNKIVTWQIIMDLEVKSYVIGTRESAIWADEITGDPLLMMQLSTFQYLIMKV